MRRWIKQISTNYIRRVEEAETFGNIQLLIRVSLERVAPRHPENSAPSLVIPYSIITPRQ